MHSTLGGRQHASLAFCFEMTLHLCTHHLYLCTLASAEMHSTPGGRQHASLAFCFEMTLHLCTHHLYLCMLAFAEMHSTPGGHQHASLVLCFEMTLPPSCQTALTGSKSAYGKNDKHKNRYSWLRVSNSGYF